jgi:hypothetical protein
VGGIGLALHCFILHHADGVAWVPGLPRAPDGAIGWDDL